MWKKEDNLEEPTTPQAQSVAPPAADSPRTRNAPGTNSIIGPSLTVVGEISGKEDLVINGTVEGKVRLSEQSVRVGKSGRIKADIRGQSVLIEGQVHGNLYGTKEVVINQSGSVRGNIVAPRVVLENGSKFKGSIDMEPEDKAKAAPQPAQAAKQPGSRPAAPGTGTSTDPSNKPKSVSVAPSGRPANA